MAIKNAITSPLLQDNEITKAERLLFEVCFSTKNPMTMSESLELNEFVGGLDPNIDVIWGALVDESLEDQIRIIVLAAGYEMDGNTGTIVEKQREAASASRTTTPVQPKPDEKPAPAPQPEPTPETPVVESQPKPMPEPTPEAPAVESQPEPTPAPAPQPTPEAPAVESQPEPMPAPQPMPEAPAVEPQPEPKPMPTPKPEPAPEVVEQPAAPAIEIKPTQDPIEGFKEICQYYGKEKAFSMQLEQIRKNYYILDDKDLTNEQLVEKLEHLPSYNRSFEQLCELKATKKDVPGTPNGNNNHDGKIF